MLAWIIGGLVLWLVWVIFCKAPGIADDAMEQHYNKTKTRIGRKYER